MSNIFYDIPEYGGIYKINKYGTVISFTKWSNGNPLVPTRYNNGYYYYSLYKDKKATKIARHRLMAIMFIPNPFSFPIINHKNNIRGDDRMENLEWCTHSYNLKHGFQFHDAWNKGRNNGSRTKKVHVHIFDKAEGAKYKNEFLCLSCKKTFSQRTYWKWNKINGVSRKQKQRKDFGIKRIKLKEEEIIK